MFNRDINGSCDCCAEQVKKINILESDLADLQKVVADIGRRMAYIKTLSEETMYVPRENWTDRSGGLPYIDIPVRVVLCELLRQAGIEAKDAVPAQPAQLISTKSSQSKTHK